MKKLVFFLLATILATSCNAQDNKILKEKPSKAEISGDSLEQPKESWKVNKEVDENGNIIRYDSVYTWSSVGPIKGIEVDSLNHRMHSLLRNHFSMLKPNTQSFKSHDSIMKQYFNDDFFEDDFFSNRINPNFPNMDDMLKRMEAMRNQFFNDNNRYIIPPERNEKKKSTKIDKNRV
ncbi:hypothetical protein [Winogradskyella vincentii]|uniref:Lipoprotein n=1 Tax=Winogradskyella vincentii TaxID=2877122 RepID=A0ABS7XYL4_9FLAO|nr:hypothetical protein [Winogradskyella vincentii]MCA0151707.1 hypothetical protein [Winogradskyella vincentii]